MKKIILFLTLVLATAIIYGYSQSGRNELAENHAMEFNKLEKEPVSRTSILLILTADKSKPGWSSSFLKNYLYGNTNKDGC